MDLWDVPMFHRAEAKPAIRVRAGFRREHNVTIERPGSMASLTSTTSRASSTASSTCCSRWTASQWACGTRRRKRPRHATLLRRRRRRKRNRRRSLEPVPFLVCWTQRTFYESASLCVTVRPSDARDATMVCSMYIVLIFSMECV